MPDDTPAPSQPASRAGGLDMSRMPYQLPFPKEAATEIVVGSAIPDDERVWVPQMENVWFRPLCLNTLQGYWVNLLRVRKAGVLSRHRHPAPVHGYVLRGRWHYLEHDWVAEEGGFAFEPPGETHTLVVPEGCEEMATLFQVNGALVYVDQQGRAMGYDDVFTRLEGARRHYESAGVDPGYLDTLIR
jgi:2,4'-dihydroxyacetophenone dioxygenase